MNRLLMLIYSKLVMKDNLIYFEEHNSFIIFNVLSSLFFINVIHTGFSRGDAER